VLRKHQTLLLPNSVADYIGPDNPVRFVEAFVDQRDLQEAGFCRVEPKETGRPGYDPADLLKLYIYGYLNRVRSSRRLEAETRRNLEVIWLLRGLTPDFKTIADFRKDNRGAFKPVLGVDAVKSGVTADPGQPAGALDGDLPRFNRLHRRLFDHLCFFLCTSPSREKWKKEKWYYA
jgi:transposase